MINITPGLIIILFFLGIDKVNRDKKEKKQTAIQKKSDDSTINNLSIEVKKLEKIKADYDEFSANLKAKLSIERDSNNQPKRVVYNTNIDKAGTVNIGR
ncbi:MAG: hypothetical protein M3O67_08145 [Bacteroidota bacterium]|nr:hypothetical protein [Bacteroidota bacterium]